MNAQCILTVLAVDTSLGKIDKHSLSQETLIELFLEGVSNKEIICDSTDDSTGISKYRYLELTDAKEITKIYWQSLQLQGSVSLQWIPPSVTYVALNGNDLSGTVDLTRLPNGLELLLLSMNRFEGTVDLTMLPENIQTLNLSWNAFFGMTDFSQLPKSLTMLMVQHTQLEGEIIDFTGEAHLYGSKVKDMRKKSEI